MIKKNIENNMFQCFSEPFFYGGIDISRHL